MALGPAAQLVAVGVDASEEASEAAAYGADVARTRGWDLMLVHSLQDGSSDAAPADRRARSQGEGDALVEEVLASLRTGDVTRLHRVVTATPPVEALREVSGYVSLLVLGQDGFTPADQLVTGRVGSAVAAEARCPVVVVPRAWRRAVPTRPVVVVLDGETSAGPSWRSALEEAELRHTAVVAVHDASGPAEDSDLEPDGTLVGTVVADGGDEHPDVQVSVLGVEGDPRTWAADARALASLVVVGRPHPGLHVAAWPRPVACTVLAASWCPLLVAPSDETAAPTGGRGRRRARARAR